MHIVNLGLKNKTSYLNHEYLTNLSFFNVILH
jgi:hypothetical protein